MNEIKFYGRGGQGVVMASQMLGLAFFKAGMYPQCYSMFGGERRGAPVLSYLRVDKEKILLKCEIKRPDELIYFDASQINLEEVQRLMPHGGRILVNTNQSKGTFQGLLGFTLGLIDAQGIVERLGIGPMINTTVLGAYCRLAGSLGIDHVVDAIRETVPEKIEVNVEAARQGYSGLTLISMET